MSPILRELKSARLIVLKAALFLVAGTLSCGLILLANPGWRTFLFLCVIVWCSARFYYFAFYVAERWVDPSYRFSGLWSLVAHALNARRHSR
jgi:hypothetical protein